MSVVIVDAYDGWTIDQVKQRCRDLCRLSMAKDLQIEEMKETLVPFIVAAKDADGYPDNSPLGCDPCMQLCGLSVGDLRRAREIAKKWQK